MLEEFTLPISKSRERNLSVPLNISSLDLDAPLQRMPETHERLPSDRSRAPAPSTPPQQNDGVNASVDSANDDLSADAVCVTTPIKSPTTTITTPTRDEQSGEVSAEEKQNTEDISTEQKNDEQKSESVANVTVNTSSSARVQPSNAHSINRRSLGMRTCPAPAPTTLPAPPPTRATTAVEGEKDVAAAKPPPIRAPMRHSIGAVHTAKAVAMQQKNFAKPPMTSRAAIVANASPLATRPPTSTNFGTLGSSPVGRAFPEQYRSGPIRASPLQAPVVQSSHVNIPPPPTNLGPSPVVARRIGYSPALTTRVVCPAPSGGTCGQRHRRTLLCTFVN